MATADDSSLPTSSIAQSLPSYIIYEILKHFSAPLALRRIAQYPWYLAHVCSSWRIEFLTMRRNFWNEIIVLVRHSETGMEKTHQRIIDVLTMFLECNRGHPFSFELEVEHGTARKSPYFFTIFSLFISESPRWQRVTLRIGMDDILGLHRVKGQLEHLESLLFYKEDNNNVPDIFMTAPCLTRVFLDGLPTCNFNWSIMTFMDLGCDHGNEVARLPSILSQAVRLETLIIYLDDHTFPSIKSIVLPNLLLLVTDWISLIQMITAPSLKRLYIVTESSVDAEPRLELVGALKSFFGRSRCHLQALKIQGLNTASVIKILSLAPDIRILCVHIYDSGVDIFGWLNGMDRLQLLVVDRCPPPARDQIHKILDFVARRKTRVGSAVEKLQKFGIIYRYWHHDREAYEPLEKQLRKTCKMYDIQYSNKRNNAVDWEMYVHQNYVYPDLDEQCLLPLC